MTLFWFPRKRSPQKAMTAALNAGRHVCHLSPPPWGSLKTKEAIMTNPSNDNKPAPETHSPLPWRVFDVLTDVEIVTDRPIARETESVVQFKGQRNAKADAAFIVRACNNYYQLLSVAKVALYYLPRQEYLQVCVTIADAEKE
jgi:hypothetical protein